jgi:conjugative relaxase-like TrwC/TraI family protein
MLSIKPIGSSGTEVAYYAGFGQEDYYLKGGEPPGRWWGTGCRSLGLKGQVEKDAFRHLLQGFSPDGGTSLVQNAGVSGRRAGFDLTWSLPKTVSIISSQGTRKQRLLIEAAAERSLSRVLGVVEEFCGVTRRGRRGTTVEKSGLLGAVFRHDTARAVSGEVPDPNIHFHTVLLNLSVREDGTTGSLDGRALFRPQMKLMLGAAFRAELAKELEALGLTPYRPETSGGRKASWFEVEGVPEELQKEFSKRRQEIKAWMKDRGLEGAKAAEQAAKATRRGKEHWTRNELLSAWQAVGREYGLKVDELFQGPPRRQGFDEFERQRLVQDVVESLTAGQSRFSELELVRRVAEAAPGTGLGIADIRNAVREALQDRELIVPLATVSGEAQYTTHEMLSVEKRLLDAVERSAHASIQPLPPADVLAVLTCHPTLRPEQAEAVRHVTLGQGGISCVNGLAGTGKTFMLKVAREIFEAAGHTVIGTALAAKAAQTLEEGSGISSVHLHSLFRELERGKRTLNQSTVVVLDEAGMVGTRMMERLVALTESAGAKLVLVGDHRQLQAIDAGAPFRVIAERVGVAELKEITRQRDEWARVAVRELARGEAGSALSRFQERGLLVVTDTRDEAMRKLVSDWSQMEATRDCLIFAGTRYETAVLNRLCQELRLLKGELGGESLDVNGCQVFVGDRVLLTRNNAALLVRNGSMGTVVGFVPEQNEVLVALDSGYQLRIDTELYPHVALSYAVTVHKGQGQTVESAFVLAGGAMTDRELAYVQGSRARGETRLYTDAASAGPELSELVRKMETSRAKDLAHEYLIEAV